VRNSGNKKAKKTKKNRLQLLHNSHVHQKKNTCNTKHEKLSNGAI